jgi:hypothetical protein
MTCNCIAAVLLCMGVPHTLKQVDMLPVATERRAGDSAGSTTAEALVAVTAQCLQVRKSQLYAQCFLKSSSNIVNPSRQQRPPAAAAPTAG